MATLAGALTGLGLLALPAVPSPTYFATASASDTWSLTITDSGSVLAEDAPIAKSASDTWSLAGTEAASSIATYPAELTYPRLGLPGAYYVLTAKAAPDVADITATDQWFLAWNEEVTDLVQVDTWDTWTLRFTSEVAGLAVTQTYAATDSWGIQFLDVGSVFVGGPVIATASDTWSLSITETATSAVAIFGSDTWSISITDSGSVAVTQDAISGSDTWSLSFVLETGFYNVLVEIPILASDLWTLTYSVEDGEVTQADQVGSAERTIVLNEQRRIIVV